MLTGNGANCIIPHTEFKYSHTHNTLILPRNEATKKKSIKKNIGTDVLSKSSIVSRKKGTKNNSDFSLQSIHQGRADGLSHTHHKSFNYLGSTAQSTSVSKAITW